jgi:hypothetical protein
MELNTYSFYRQAAPSELERLRFLRTQVLRASSRRRAPLLTLLACGLGATSFGFMVLGWTGMLAVPLAFSAGFFLCLLGFFAGYCELHLLDSASQRYIVAAGCYMDYVRVLSLKYAKGF